MKPSPPESVEDDGALVELKAGVQQLGGHHRGVAEAGRLGADFFTVEDDVLPVSPEDDGDDQRPPSQHATRRFSLLTCAAGPAACRPR